MFDLAVDGFAGMSQEFFLLGVAAQPAATV
jgi:hypothetical protein